MFKPLAATLRGAALGLGLGLALIATPAHAGLSFTGSFDTDDALWLKSFSLATASTFDATTLGFAGGVNQAGDTIAAGGFAPVLSLFQDGPGGLLLQLAIGSSNACGPGSGPVDAGSGFCWDAHLSASLLAGDYLLVLSQDGNLPFGPAFADGFSQTGAPDFTGQSLGLPGQQFLLVNGQQRDGHWAVDLSLDAPNAAPEPSALTLTLLALLGLGVRRRSI